MVRTAALVLLSTFIGSVVSPFGDMITHWGKRPPLEARRTSAFTGTVGEKDRHAAVRLTRSGDGLFHVPVEINGQMSSFIIDTGANVTVLTAADAQRLGISAGAQAVPGMLQTASGSSAMRWMRVNSLRVAGQTIRQVDVAVVGQGMMHSLLGQDVLGGLGAMTIDGDELEIKALAR
ncbi:MAG: retropepsin-like aspartic protease [Sphingomonas sp.]|jgi:clan AA aspartic protease (TIGR02281 family)